MGRESASDLVLAALAGRQFGVVAHAQLVEAGLTRREIYRRVQAGRLHPLHRGVYAVGHRVLKAEGRWMAAVLAAGEGAVLSDGTAAAVWQLRGVGKARDLDALVDRADQRGLVDFVALRSSRSASLQAVLESYNPAPTRSELERAFLRLCDDHGIPPRWVATKLAA